MVGWRPRASMKTSIVVVVVAGMMLAAAGAMAIGAGGSRAQTGPGPCDPLFPGVSPIEQDLLDVVHDWRANQFGFGPMTISTTANLAAQWFAEAMVTVNTNGHIDQYERNWIDRLRDCGYDSFWAGGSGESLAGFASSNPAVGSTPEEALAVFLQGYPNHQSGITAGFPYPCVGVGYAQNLDPDPGQRRFAWVVLVAQIGSSQSCPQSALPATATPTATATAIPTDMATPTATATETETPTETATETATATPTETPDPAEYEAFVPLTSRDP